jgi:hypothetical protein
MSHFLERLASNVTKPVGQASQPALRPLLGSVYAPERAPSLPRAAGMQSFPVEEERIETSADSRLENAVRSGRRSTQVESNLQATHTESEPSASQHAAHTLQFEDSSPAEALLPAAKAEEHNMHFVAVLPAGEQHAAPPSEREEAAVPRDLRTVVDLLMRPSQPEASAAALSQASRSAGNNTRTTSREPAREPDEITIHIGRIEVTAAPQPMARPAAAPARRSMSLDEYLKRGNGRAR